jgi:flagellar protein FlbD
VIPLHRLGGGAERILLNPDLVVCVEAHPDTVLTLTTGAKVIVAETPEQVVRLVRSWRTRIFKDAMAGVRPAA